MEYLIILTYVTMVSQAVSVCLFFWIASKLRRQWASGIACFAVSIMIMLCRQFIVAYGMPGGDAYLISQAVFPMVSSFLMVGGALLLWQSARNFEKRLGMHDDDIAAEIDGLIKTHLEELAAANKKLLQCIGKKDAN